MKYFEERRSVEVSQQPIYTKIIIFLSFILLIITFPISIFGCIKIINEYERGVLLRLGRICHNEIGPGVVFINPFIDKCIIIDLRMVTFTIPSQEILSKDSVSINIDAVVYFQVANPVKAINNVKNYKESTILLSQTILKNISGTKNLLELLQFKENISYNFQNILTNGTKNWGIKIYKVELKDIFISDEMQNIMASEGKAIRIANAKIIINNGEKEASERLKEAADMMSKNSTTMYLKYLQTLNNIGRKDSQIIIFPFSIELITYLFQSFNKTKSDKNVINRI
uniref:PHB domain-containing protein n=1 Tax=Strongyloides stercoralis TaxID=6248 RepID=A0A0K0ENX8_STRER